MPDIGNTLREARIRRGLSITDVENITKIRSKYLEALEENDFEVLPGPTVVKGFLRSYATFLKLESDLLLYEYRSSYETHREDIGALRTELSQQRRSRTSVERKKKRTRRTQRGYVAAALLAVVIIVVIAFLASGGRGGGAMIGAENIPSSTTLPATTTVTGGGAGTSTIEVDDTSTTEEEGTSTTKTGAGTSSSVVVPSTTGENVTMVLTVTEGSCWLVVREDSESGAEKYAGTLSAGGQQTFNSAKRYWVRAGNPEALSITINGTPFTVSGGPGTFLITETGVDREQSDSTQTTE